MEIILIKIFAFLRPVMFIDLNVNILGLNLFELSAMAFFGLLVFMIFMKASIRRNLSLSGIDFFIVAFAVWCLAVYLIYIEKADIKEMLKLVIPLFTYIVAKKIILDRKQYLNVMFFIILGFAIPEILSALYILIGKGVYTVNYWTGLVRHQGVYANSHNMAHNMTLSVMLIVIYVTLAKLQGETGKRYITGGVKVLFIVVAGLALYLLYNSFVRTSILGLVIFTFLYLWFFNKKLLGVWTVALGITAVLAGPLLYLIFFDVVDVVVGDRTVERLGSGRLYIWSHNLSVFSSLSFDRQLAGVGIGNRVDAMRFVEGTDNVWNSHNDYLEVLMQTGIVGFILFMSIQILFIKRIQKMEGREKYIFVAFFAAISFMNFVSNSYVTRFGLAQLFFLIMTYVELPEAGEKRIAVVTQRPENRRLWHI